MRMPDIFHGEVIWRCTEARKGLIDESVTILLSGLHCSEWQFFFERNSEWHFPTILFELFRNYSASETSSQVFHKILMRCCPSIAYTLPCFLLTYNLACSQHISLQILYDIHLKETKMLKQSRTHFSLITNDRLQPVTLFSSFCCSWETSLRAHWMHPQDAFWCEFGGKNPSLTVDSFFRRCFYRHVHYNYIMQPFCFFRSTGSCHCWWKRPLKLKSWVIRFL